MADTTGTRQAFGKMLGLCVEIWSGTTGAASTDTCNCKTAMASIIAACPSWAEDIGGTAVTLDCTISGGAVGVMTNANLAKAFNMIVVGYP